MTSIRIQHYSDILCVWAYVAQARIAELEDAFPDEVVLDYHWFHVFGDVRARIFANWREKGGAAGYGDHVREVVARFGHVPVHERIWAQHAPTSSMPAHLLLCAVRLLDDTDGKTRVADVASAVRSAFFRDLIDVSDWAALIAIASRIGLPVQRLQASVDSGAAHAALAADLDLARDNNIRASPTLMFNEGRQRLTGNVGYRVIEANVRELLQTSGGGQSWC
jgi:predicted DsbA family dithiol-disulfide isomerase